MNDSMQNPKDISILAKQFVFTVTTGRSGTQYLAELLANNLPKAQVHHEQRSHHDWGKNCPDVSHTTTFNQVSGSRRIRDFWIQKFARIKTLNSAYYAETSHVLAKAGLLENLDLIIAPDIIHIIYLKRDIADTVLSLTHRADFSTKGNMWLWYLDPNYPNVIVNPEIFKAFGQIGLGLWYVIEMRTRAEYYRLFLAGKNNVAFHEVELEDIATPNGASRFLAALGIKLPLETIRMPGKINANVGPELAQPIKQMIRELVAACQFDTAEMAHHWYDQGYRLFTYKHP